MKNRIVYTTAFWNVTGFLMGTLPPIFIDPILTHHVQYPCRQYRHIWLVYIAACILPVFTIALGRMAKWRNRSILLNIPFIAICIPMFILFRPEFPHVNLMFIFLVTLILSISTIFIHDIDVYDNKVSHMDTRARIELIKENLSLWKMTCLGLAFGLLGGMIAILADMQAANAYILQDYRAEVIIVNRLSYLSMTYICLYAFFGPVYECAVKIIKSIENLKAIEPDSTNKSTVH